MRKKPKKKPAATTWGMTVSTEPPFKKGKFPKGWYVMYMVTCDPPAKKPTPKNRKRRKAG